MPFRWTVVLPGDKTQPEPWKPNAQVLSPRPRGQSIAMPLCCAGRLLRLHCHVEYRLSRCGACRPLPRVAAHCEPVVSKQPVHRGGRSLLRAQSREGVEGPGNNQWLAKCRAASRQAIHHQGRPFPIRPTRHPVPCGSLKQGKGGVWEPQLQRMHRSPWAVPPVSPMSISMGAQKKPHYWVLRTAGDSAQRIDIHLSASRRSAPTPPLFCTRRPT